MVTIITTTALAVSTAHGEKGNVLFSGIPDPIGLVLDKRQNLYMADRQNGYVYCVPLSGDPILLAGVPGTPTALAVDTLRNVFVSTSDGHIYRVALDGSVAETYTCPTRPVGMSIDRDGDLIVATEDGVVRKVKRARLGGKTQ